MRRRKSLPRVFVTDINPCICLVFTVCRAVQIPKVTNQRFPRLTRRRCLDGKNKGENVKAFTFLDLTLGKTAPDPQITLENRREN